MERYAMHNTGKENLKVREDKHDENVWRVKIDKVLSGYYLCDINIDQQVKQIY